MELFEVGRQQVTLRFDGGQVVSDAGLLSIRQLDQELGILAEAARRLPDPRSQMFVVHSAEKILTQQVYQLLAGYPDGNDAELLRDDPLFKTIAGRDPRFGYATNEVLKRRVREEKLEETARLLRWITEREAFQLFHTFDDYQADSWPIRSGSLPRSRSLARAGVTSGMW